MQMMAMVQAQAKAKQQEEQQAKDSGLMGRLMGMPVEQQQAPGAMGPGAPMPNSGIDPRTFLAQGGSRGGLMEAMQLNDALRPPKPAAPIVSKPGDIARDPTTGAQLWQNPEKPEKPEKLDPNKPFMVIDGKIVPNPAYQDYEIKKAKAGASNVRVDNRPLLTKGQEKVDTEFGQVYADFIASGGVADVTKQLKQLRDASVALGSDQSLTGPVRGQLPESVRSITNPKAVATKNAVEEVVQRNLRLVLGAQFTEKEGERLIARAYNPLLMPEENKRRVDRLIQQIESAAAAKIDAARYYEANGTLQGWRGKLPTISDIEQGLEAPMKPLSIDDLVKKYGG
jgi:hypothetical protein